MKFFKDREFIISYIMASKKLNRTANGHTIRKEGHWDNINYKDWNSETTDYWNKQWGTDDVSIVITNIYENK